jgi:transcriptional regulator with XRE-family HTH domain
MTTDTPAIFTSQEARCLDLLATGIPTEQVAAALGISVSRISQYLSEEHFASALATRRFEALAKHNARDSELDALEDTLIQQLKRCVPLATRPMEITRIFQVINAAKRRGQSAPTAITEQQTVIKLTIPVQLINQFQLDTNNQVISTGQTNLVTIQSGRVSSLTPPKKELTYVQPSKQDPDFGFSTT